MFCRNTPMEGTSNYFEVGGIECDFLNQSVQEFCDTTWYTFHFQWWPMRQHWLMGRGIHLHKHCQIVSLLDPTKMESTFISSTFRKSRRLCLLFCNSLDPFISQGAILGIHVRKYLQHGNCSGWGSVSFKSYRRAFSEQFYINSHIFEANLDSSKCIVQFRRKECKPLVLSTMCIVTLTYPHPESP